MWEVHQRLPVFKPLNVAFAEVLGWAAKDYSCPRQEVSITTNNQLYLFDFSPLNVHLPLGQYGRIGLQ